MNERLQLPLRPAGTSLAAYVAALDLLAGRLDLLPSRSHWPARIPINSKASFDGDIVHTNQFKVHVGGEWWVEMSASEAAAYVRRRKAYFLDEHARLMEGKPRAFEEVTGSTNGGDIEMSSATESSHYPARHVKFDPLFANPVRVGSPDTSPDHITTTAEGGQAVARTAPKTTTSNAATETPPAGPSTSDADLPPDLQKLVDLMGEHMLQDKMALPKANDANETVNEEGLPIHEIRETLDGDTIGDAPHPSGEGYVESVDTKDADYWTPEAEARREALRRRIFHEDSSDEEDEYMDMDASAPASTLPVAPMSAPAPAATIQPNPTPFPLSAALPVGSRSPGNTPKSILKVPQRKKSVSFDPSTRLPPDSPPPQNTSGRLGFPLSDFAESGPKAVPILAPPTPGRKTAPAATFGGFKRGFLSGPGSVPPPVPSESGGPTIVEVDDDVEMKDEPPMKKQSLFAQRRAERAPKFPRLADAKPMAVMKTDIVEKPSSVADHISNPASLTPPVRLPTPTVPKAPVMPSVVGSLPPTVGAKPAPTSSDAKSSVVMANHDDGDDDSDYGDLGEFSDEEEDEYALDEALLAREVALAYHRRQGWQRPIDEDEIDPETEGQEQSDGHGGVLMGIPRVSTISGGDSEDDPLRIVNPTADDLSQFLRVGRTDDGELVFERPIVDSGSESDGEGGEEESNTETETQRADRLARRARRKDVMERLLRGDYEDEAVVDSPERQRETWERTLPPTVGAAPVTANAASTPAAPVPAPAPRRIETGPVVERSAVPVAPTSPAAPADEAPRRVSRFKAARQAQQ